MAGVAVNFGENLTFIYSDNFNNSQYEPISD